MKVVIDIPEDRYADIQRIASVQLERRWPTPEQIIAKGVTINEPRKGKWIDYSDEGFVECPFCHSATNCDGNKDELHYCFSCGAELRGDKK